ncbi:MAG: serine hydrolase [Bacteroidota bacterium]|nr:serine hydrolase [Bacteroidota bacterium]
MKQLTLIFSGLFLSLNFAFAQRQPDLKKLDAYITNAMQQFGQPGLAVGIVKDGNLIWSKGYGTTDLSGNEKVTANTIFTSASLSKAFTACAIGILVDEGKLNFDDPVIKHFPEFRTADPFVTANMKIKDLLSHRAGWITFDGDLLWYGTDLDPMEILARHAKEPLTYGFRDRFGYSNLMFIVAAQVIERVSGNDWDTFITDRILKPLQMTRTTVETAALKGMNDVALPHVPDREKGSGVKSMAHQPLKGADGATGINTCVTDLAKWDAMWMDEGKVSGTEFLKERTWITITTNHLNFPVAPDEAATGKHYDGAALGWFTEDRNGVKIITHSGGLPGFILNHAVVPEKDLAVIALANAETYISFAITDKVLDLYLGAGKADPVADMMPQVKTREERTTKRLADRTTARVSGTSPSAGIDRITGTYEDKVYGEAVIGNANGTPTLTFMPAKDLFTGTLEHWHHDTWKWDHIDPFLEPGWITFTFDTDHNITGFKIDLVSPDFHFYKLDFKRKAQ